jgi:hypothetical protein
MFDVKRMIAQTVCMQAGDDAMPGPARRVTGAGRSM